MKKGLFFSLIAAVVVLASCNKTLPNPDQINFAAQKDQAGGKKTMKAYLWKICGEKYDAEHAG